MTPSSSGRSDDSENADRRVSFEAAQAPTPPDRELLESVLQQTVFTASSGEPVDPQVMQALRQVAQRRRGEMLSLDPVVVELVEAALSTHFESISAPPEFWRKISREIAATLMDDPAAQRRLLAFWKRLTEAEA